LKLFVYGLLKEGYGLNYILSNSNKMGTYVTKRSGLMMTGLSYPWVWEKETSKYNIKGELYDMNKLDLQAANSIEFSAGYYLKEIDSGIYGYIYPEEISTISSMINMNTEKKYYEWTKQKETT